MDSDLCDAWSGLPLHKRKEEQRWRTKSLRSDSRLIRMTLKISMSATPRSNRHSRSAKQGAPGVLAVPREATRNGSQSGSTRICYPGFEIGRESCRERVCQKVKISVVWGQLKKKTERQNK